MNQVGESVSLGTLFSSQGSRASFAVTPCEGSYSVRLALPGRSFWVLLYQLPGRCATCASGWWCWVLLCCWVLLYRISPGCASCAVLHSLRPNRQVHMRLVRTRSVIGATRSLCAAESHSIRVWLGVQLGLECSRWPLTCDRTSTGLASRSVLRSGHSLHSLAQSCQVRVHLRRSEPV